MAIRRVAQMGHPILRQVARELTPKEIRSPEIRALVADMLETMHDYGGIGLAAPQVRESVQLALVEVDPENERYQGLALGDGQPLMVVINPKITVLDPTEQKYWEGCLSVDGLRGLVPRPRKIRVDFLDLDAKPQSVEAEGFLATVFQHEIDHLFGKLFIDRIQDTTKLAFLAEYERYWVADESSGVDGELAD